ncbi:MAG: imidazoleglycerol-phosphate dehydratase HisB [Dehalococcoidia bacterium]|nr:imidazoleglycerol-phosphate dehydratase HisB [Dehalococcoidia bacterium]
MTRRLATVKRETTETSVNLEIDIDGKGDYEITTGIRMFDHLLTQLARHGAFDIRIAATGADPHHLVEDVAISLGRAFNQALGDKRGIVRMAHAVIPMDDALALVAVDISGRGYCVSEMALVDRNVADLPSNLVSHFLESFASEARLNLHAKLLRGSDDHHKAEATFKALARSLDAATRLDPRISGKVPSTKDVID